MTPAEKARLCMEKKYSGAYLEYWIKHPMCEICLEMGLSVESGLPHHIKTRGAGGTDDASNLLALCTKHDRLIHNVGDLRVAKQIAGEVGLKIMAVKGLTKRRRP